MVFDTSDTQFPEPEVKRKRGWNLPKGRAKGVANKINRPELLPLTMAQEQSVSWPFSVV
jgi:hypothetical protein